MDWLFGRRQTPEEMLRANQRLLSRAIRDLDRETNQLTRQEGKLIGDIKKMAKEGQMDSVKVLAKDLVRTRRYKHNFAKMRARIESVRLQIAATRSQTAIAKAMRGVTGAMQRINGRMQVPQMQQLMTEFVKQNEMMGLKEEMMEESIDDALGDEDDEEESEMVVAKVLDELGIELSEQLTGLPSMRAAAAAVPEAAAAKTAVLDADADLAARLDNLRKQ